MHPSKKNGPDITHSRAEFESQAVAHLPADGRAVTRALRVARAFCDQAAIEADAADRLAIVVEEWIANVTEHGDARPRSRIVLRLARIDTLVVVVVTDAGLPFDPRTATFKGPDLERGGGAGLELIRAWSRIAAYGRRAGRNRLVLEMPIA